LLCELRYINLERRVDKRQNTESNLRLRGIGSSLPVSRFSAVEDAECPQLGCAQSHLNCLSELASRSSAQYFLIFEDDFRFSITEKDLISLIIALDRMPINWKVWQIYATHHTSLHIGTLPEPDQSVNVLSILRACSTVAYLVRASAAQELIANFRESAERLSINRQLLSQLHKSVTNNHQAKEAFVHWSRLIDVMAVDNVWVAMQAKRHFVGLDLEIGRCEAGFSDVRGEFRDGVNGALGEGKQKGPQLL